MTLTIVSLKPREILDSRGNPTVEVELSLSNQQSVTAAVPSGASTGKHEAVELRDQDSKRYFGKGVLKAIQNIQNIIAPHFIGQNPTQQKTLDEWMIAQDGTFNKSHLGANAMLAVSLAVAKAGALANQQSFHDYLAQEEPQSLPVPLMNVINGGAHADNGLNFQEFMLMPVGFDNFAHALRCGTEIFHVLKKILSEQKLSTSVGDEGGFAPHLSSHAAALDLLADAIQKAGYRLGEEVFLALDVASSEFYRDGHYHLTNEKCVLDSAGMVKYLTRLVDQYPIISIEDGMAEEDWAGWQLLTQTLGKRVQLVGDDLFVTNTHLLQRGIEERSANAILIKPNQIGTVTETIAAIHMAKDANFGTIMSHRSGETEDTSIADMAVGLNTLQIKTGSLSRTDRLAKYNQLLRIASENPKMPYAGDALKNLR